MWFGVLGPLLVRDGDTVVDVPKGRLRVLLAALLVRAGQVVPTDVLAEVVWDGSPPGGAVTTLRSYVRRLRGVLGPAAGERVVTRHPGYLLQAGVEEVDLLRFGSLSRKGGAAARAGQWERAWELLGEGLGLWRGEPLADVPSDLLRRGQGPELARLRLEAVEWRADAGLQLRRHHELVAELQSLTAAHPLRERFHAQLMVALVRCGRRAEALDAYQHAREVLVEELGTEPGAGLRELHQQILTDDPALSVLDPTVPTADHRAGVVPRELPAPIADFVGRRGELEALTGLLNQIAEGLPPAMVISSIGGTAGIGKTALALHWAHQAAHLFSDGQLYVNMRGFDPSGIPATPAEATRGFLHALGVPPERIPPTTDAQAGLYRSLLADRKMLIVLDNARDEQQVRPLLPASPASLVIITSRNQLAGLAATDSTRLLSLDVLTHDEAAQLLTTRIGHVRAAATPEAIAEIATLCACLPLALAVAAARAVTRPAFPLAAVAAELRDAAGRLDALDAGDPAASVRSVFSWSYQQLSPPAARMFRLLGLHPGPEISIPAAASLAAVDEPAARRLLRELTRDCLITEHAPARYAFHDLLRAYAAAQAREHDSATECESAVGRVLDHYLHTAVPGSITLDPSRDPVTLAPPRPAVAPEQLANHRQALAWFETEHRVLLAAAAFAESADETHAWQLPWAMVPFLRYRGHYQERAATLRSALAAATRLGDTAGQAICSRLLAAACADLRDDEQALALYASSLDRYQQLRDRLGEARVHQSLAALAERHGRYVRALRHNQQALRLYQAIGDKMAQALALNGVGWCHCLLGDYEQARVLCTQALSLSGELGFRLNEGHTLDSLGFAEHHLGNHAEAAACYERALAILREFGVRSSEATILTHLGDTRHAADDLPRAREAWRQALTILEDLDHPGAGQVRAKLAGIAD